MGITDRMLLEFGEHMQVVCVAMCLCWRHSALMGSKDHKRQVILKQITLIRQQHSNNNNKTESNIKNNTEHVHCAFPAAAAEFRTFRLGSDLEQQVWKP